MVIRAMRAALLATAFGASSLTGGCGTDTTADREPDPAPADEVVEILEAFWAERVRVESSGRYDTADFSGILDRRLAEPQQKQYREFEQIGFRRVGEPRLRDFTADVDGDTAIATVCVQEDQWGAEADIEVVEPEPQGWYASSHQLERTDGVWLIVDTAKPPAGVSCEGSAPSSTDP